MRVFALLDRAAAEVRRIEEFVGQLLLHGLAVAARPRVRDQPADAEGEAPVRIDFDRHLIVRAAHAPRFHFEAGLDVVDRLLEHLQRIVARLFLDDVEALINDSLSGAALAAVHDAVDELAHQRALIERIRRDVTFRDFTSTRHFLNPRCLKPSWAASLRTWSGPAFFPERRPRRA